MYRHQNLTVVPLSVFSVSHQRSGVRAQAWQPAADQLQAASGSVAACASRLVAVSVLVHGMLRLPSGKRCPPAWPKLVMASALAHDKVRGCW
ncbi:hypothetical protein PR002_g29044 [Phytophthora rubi]|uniref:Uncharacterized protein n=1 Tax=Phytophthora rubi TaxID=129364 RepID=A0A6A3H3Q5_9STRA|nr:hypothetical protein PR002_g29044 [Phytophthora rubi]